MGSMITLAMVNRNMKPPSSTMGESGDGSVANTRRRREVELNGCGEWMTLQIGGGKGDDVVVFSKLKTGEFPIVDELIATITAAGLIHSETDESTHD